MTDQMEVPPMSRETRAAFHRGYETAIQCCILVVQNGEAKTKREMISAMRDLIIQQVPKAEQPKCS